ncbi:hypothetical protein SK803_02315 [Lentzea sp. BCCO 10_0856]|uniref:Uncharacterized protein n=1 Tax=Lentzea miocenica TaxID=3095431 RepID=A0ABU4ST87_9PSEU|nr:hypothetical protein [Lentzea sp. BCCO 10_0856]MDX8029022.1 hypothetical protein [Lentzea sp. BCCO 10_0856]
MSYGPSAQTKGPALGLLALALGLAGVVVTFLPINLDGVRPYLAWAFGLPGFVVAILGLLGPRQGKAFAVIGALLSLLAVFVGMITLGNLTGLL